MLAALALALLQSGPIQIYKGADLGGTVRYWDVSETSLDASQPNKNFGGAYTASVGPGKVLLIRFGNLASALADHPGRVRSARLVLNYLGAEKPVFHGISKVLQAWGEGPIITLESLRPPKAKPGEPLKPERAPKGSATWSEREAGLYSWQEPGAGGPEDAIPVAGAKCTILNDHRLAIDGLGEVVEAMRTHWYDNDGFAVTFDSPLEITTSKSPQGRPTLEVETDGQQATPSGADLSVVGINRTPDRPSGGQDVTLTAHIKNVGDAASAGFNGAWITQGRKGSQIELSRSIAPGEEVTLQTTMRARPDSDDHTLEPVLFEITPNGPDADASNDACEIQEDGLTVDLMVPASPRMEDSAQRLIRVFNEQVLRESRFSFARDGALERLNLGKVTASPDGTWGCSFPAGPNALSEALSDYLSGREQIAKIRDEQSAAGFIARFPGLLGWGDTRCEGTVAPQLTLDYQAVYNPLFEALRPQPTDLLNGTTVALINRTLGRAVAPTDFDAMPRTTLIRALDFSNLPLKDAEMSFFDVTDGKVAPAPFFTGTTGQTGTVLVPSRTTSSGATTLFGSVTNLNAQIQVRATLNGESTTARLAAWQLFDMASRGNQAAAIFDLFFSLPMAPLDATHNLAKDRIVSDSAGQAPEKLVGLVDGQEATACRLGNKEGDWVEIDLGRDRPAGEVKLYFGDRPFWKKYDIVVYSTGQTINDGAVWSKETDLDYTLAARSTDEGQGIRSVTYRGIPQRFRYVRIVCREASPAELSEVKVTPVKIGDQSGT